MKPRGKKKQFKKEFFDRLSTGEMIHVGFRKWCFAPEAHKIWKLISQMNPDDWNGLIGSYEELIWNEVKRLLRRNRRKRKP